MRELKMSVPELFMIAATRGLLGVGVGLLVASKLDASRRTAVGTTLAIVGALATIPLALEVFGHRRREMAAASMPA
jgi:hypothetical protein